MGLARAAGSLAAIGFSDEERLVIVLVVRAEKTFALVHALGDVASARFVQAVA